MELRNDHAFRAVDDERALRRHERNFAHVNFLFLGPLLLPELERHVERGAKRLAFPLGFQRRQLRFADFVMRKIEGRFLIVTLDRKHFLEHRLESGIFPL